MEIRGLIWLDEIADKLAWKHNVDKAEVREVFGSNPRIRFVEKGHRRDENLYAAFGRTDHGRYLILFFVLKDGGRALLVSGRDMTAKERRYYGKK